MESPRRRHRTFFSAGTKWQVRSLVPADFFNCSAWPFCLFSIDGLETEMDKLRKRFSGKGLKDKRLAEAERETEELEFQTIFKGVVSPVVSRPGIGVGYNFSRIKANPKLLGRLLAEIVRLSYGVSGYQVSPVVISKEFARMILFSSRASGMEPWALYSGSGPAALFNPARWDFNLMIQAYGAQLDAEVNKSDKGRGI